MATKSQQPKRRENVLSSLNMAIDALNLTKEALSITPAKAACGAVSVILTMIKESMINELDYVELGLFCASICDALGRGMNGKKLDDLSQSVCDAIGRLTTTVAQIRGRVTEKSRRNGFSRLIHARSDKEMIVAWKSDLNGILAIFNTELMVNAHTILGDIHRNVVKTRGAGGSRDPAAQNMSALSTTKGYSVSSAPIIRGESPPPPPRIFFGRNELIEKIVGFAERLQPIALIGAGGIGKTSTALTALHDDRIKQRFGDDRRFIRCDKFPASLPHFLHRLSKVIGAGIKNPEDLSPLRPFLSSKDMIIVLDNAESILDPRGTNAQEIYAVVEELSQMSSVCLCITSRISTVPPDFEWLDIPTLSMEAACDTFYRIHKHGERSRVVTNILRQLDFHALSITLLATVAHQNKWDTNRLAREWDKHRTDMLQTDHNKSLAAAIELSLSSLMFRELGPNARELLGVVAFFPQGIDKNNIDWLFPTIINMKDILDKFCVLSLTYQSDGFITMLAPIRDHLSPKDPTLAPLLCLAKERYFGRLSVDVEPGKPGFEEARWIVSEDVNVEHLLNIFTTEAMSGSVWDACADFMKHLSWHKPRLTTLGPKIEALPDDHPSKVECLFQLSRLFHNVGNHTERKRILTHVSKLSRERGDDRQLGRTLRNLSRAHGLMGLYEEGIQQAKEASEISERLGDTVEQVDCLMELAWLLYKDKQFDAAEEAIFRAIGLLPEKGEPFQVCRCHHLLGVVYRSKGKTEKAIHHFEIALDIASSFNWLNQLFWIHHSMAQLFSNEGRFDDANAHVEHAKSHAVNNHDTYTVAHAVFLQATIWHRQHRLGEAKSEALRAADVFEKLGAATDAKRVGNLLQRIDDDSGRLTESKQWRRRLPRVFRSILPRVTNTSSLHPTPC